MGAKILYLLLLGGSFCCYCDAQTVLNVVPGMLSKATKNEGLTLPATSTFKPITSLTTNIHLDKSFAVFIHYQITIGTANTDFYSKLMINYANAGSLVHSGKQIYKTATGFYMTKFNPGCYTIKVHYKSPIAMHWYASLAQLVGTGRLQCYKSFGLKMPMVYQIISTSVIHFHLQWMLTTTGVPLEKLPNDRIVACLSEMITPQSCVHSFKGKWIPLPHFSDHKGEQFTCRSSWSWS